MSGRILACLVAAMGGETIASTPSLLPHRFEKQSRWLIVLCLSFLPFPAGETSATSIELSASALFPTYTNGTPNPDYDSGTIQMTGPYSGYAVAGASTVDPGARYDGGDQAGSASAYASVDLASGTLRAYTEASGGQQATAIAAFTEQVYDFRWTDPSKTDPIQIGYTVALDGVFLNLSTDPDFGKTVFPSLSALVSVTDETNHLALVAQTGDFNLDQVQSGVPFSYSFNSVAEAPWEFVEPGHVYSLSAKLVLDVYAQGDYACPGIPNCSLFNHASLDLGHTMTFNLVVPEGVTYQSASGIFLTAVPETPSFVLLGLGLMLLALTRRKAFDAIPRNMP